MLEKFHGFPMIDGCYRMGFETESGIEIRNVWAFRDGHHNKRRTVSVNAPVPPVLCDYTPLPGTQPHEWDKSITNNDGAVRLLVAVIRRAQKDCFSKGRKAEAYVARWFLSGSYYGRKWIEREESKRRIEQNEKFSACESR